MNLAELTLSVGQALERCRLLEVDPATLEVQIDTPRCDGMVSSDAGLDEEAGRPVRFVIAADTC